MNVEMSFVEADQTCVSLEVSECETYNIPLVIGVYGQDSTISITSLQSRICPKSLPNQSLE